MKNGFVLIVMVLALSGCAANEERMSENQRDMIVDSIVGTRIGELQRQAMEDLDKRKAIEVKAKADSMLMSMQDSLKQEAAPADNTIPNNLPMP